MRMKKSITLDIPWDSEQIFYKFCLTFMMCSGVCFFGWFIPIYVHILCLCGYTGNPVWLGNELGGNEVEKLVFNWEKNNQR